MSERRGLRPDPAQLAEVEPLEAGVDAHPRPVAHGVLEPDRGAVDEDQLDLRVGHPERLDRVLHGRRSRERMLDAAAAPRGWQKIVQLRVEPEESVLHRASSRGYFELTRMEFDPPQAAPPLVAPIDGSSLAEQAADRQELRIVSYNVRYFGHAAARARQHRAARSARIARALADARPARRRDLPAGGRDHLAALADCPRPPRGRGDDPARVVHGGASSEAFRCARASPSPTTAFYFRAHAYSSAASVALHHRARGPGEPPHGCRSTAQRRIARTTSPTTTWCASRTASRAASAPTCASADPPGRPLHVFNTHLCLPTPFAREFWTRKEKMGFGVNQLHEARTLCDLRLAPRAGASPSWSAATSTRRRARRSTASSPRRRHFQRRAGGARADRPPTTRAASRPPGFMRLRMHLDHLFSQRGALARPGGDVRGRRPQSQFAGLSDHVPLIGRFTLAG